MHHRTAFIGNIDQAACSPWNTEDVAASVRVSSRVCRYPAVHTQRRCPCRPIHRRPIFRHSFRQRGSSDDRRTVSGAAHLGWRPFFEEQFANTQAKVAPARVLIGRKPVCPFRWNSGMVREIAGCIHYTARTAGDYPAVGDWVIVRTRQTEGTATIRAISRALRRSSARFPAREEAGRCGEHRHRFPG
jgi:hypothetical protein